jgi:RimJ/RimL family protein N-acetyltransferase
VKRWRHELPELHGPRVHLREPLADDAPILLREICADEVCAYVPPPPTSVDALETLVAVMAEWRRTGRGFAFVVRLLETGETIGLIQFLSTRHTWPVRVSTRVPWEWGFALGSRFWRRGLFREAATLALRFAFEVVGLPAVDAWVLAANERGNAALARLGATSQRRTNSFAPDGRRGDFYKWTITRTNMAIR